MVAGPCKVARAAQDCQERKKSRCQTDSTKIVKFFAPIRVGLKGWIRCNLRAFSEHFYCARGPSLVELKGDNDSATSTVAVVRVSPKEYVWPSHIAEY